MKSITGNIVDVIAGTISKGIIHFENGKICDILPAEFADNEYIIPGFVDAHIHIESSMMVPAEFAQHSLIHGTIACVCDPHEIANVCGAEGVDYMIENASHSPMKFYFGAPSCVPSTRFETSGAVLDAESVEKLLSRDDIYFLAEMMNFPGVIHNNQQVHAKLNAAKRHEKPIDGHAPEIKGSDLKAYTAAGITTDHECMTLAEAEEKIALGMTIQIREGSAAKNFDDLLPLIEKYPDKVMFCSDDKHPDDLLKNGHINSLAKRALSKEYPIMDILRVCSLNPVKHYKLDVGLLQIGDPADFLIVNNLNDLDIKASYIGGEKVVESGKVLAPRHKPTEIINQFNALNISTEQLRIRPTGKLLKVIKVDDGQLYTHELLFDPTIENDNVVSDVKNDVLKLVVYNRYRPSQLTIGFINGLGIKQGALASTVAHDSHNIVAVGTSDEEIVLAVNKIIESKGGIIASNGTHMSLLPLPVGGLMSDDDGITIANKYEQVDKMAKELGSTLTAPFMTLAFMSLLVIPELKLGDKGLFDGKKFEFTNLMI